MDWPRYRKASELAGEVFPVSEAVILEAARKHRIGRKMGRAVIFSAADCDRLYEVLPCPSNFSAAPARPTGLSAAPSGEYALRKALELATGAQPRRLGQSAKPKSSRNRSTGVVLSLPSQRLP